VIYTFGFHLVCFRVGRNGSITGNDISKNTVGIGMGIFMGDFAECVVTENNFAQNTNLAIRIDSDVKDSSFYLNNFLNNNNGSTQVSIKGRFVYKGDEGYDYTSKVFPQFVASYNAWDNGSVGNYWSDKNSTDGTAYQITERNIDNYPMLSPIKFSPIELPSTEVPQELSGFIQLGTQTILVTLLVLAVVVSVITVVITRFKKARNHLKVQ